MRVKVSSESFTVLEREIWDSYLKFKSSHDDYRSPDPWSVASTDSEQRQDETCQKSKRRRKRIEFTANQLEVLKSAFAESKRPDRAALEELGSKIDVSVENVKNWFKNRRIREERMKDEKTHLEKKEYTIFTPEHLMVLESFYAAKVYPNGKEYQQLEMKLNIPEKNLKDWFARRRKKEKKTKGKIASGEKLKKLKDRIVFMPEELQVLESSFVENKHPHSSKYAELAIKIGVPRKNVRMWFEYRRRKEKKIQDKAKFQEETQKKIQYISYTREQVQTLESFFDKTAYPSVLEYQELEMKLNISDKNIKDWFARRREKKKRMKGSMMYLDLENQPEQQFSELQILYQENDLIQLLDSMFDEALL